jgi:hypothetical protein
VDGSETGSAKWPEGVLALPRAFYFVRTPAFPQRIRSRLVHLRPPSIDQGVQAGLWGIGLALIIWMGLLSFGVSGATSFIMSALAGCAIFLYVRLFGGDTPQRPKRRMP